MVNTTNSIGRNTPDGNPHHVVNTSRILEEDLTYTDEEPEVAHVLPATDWYARIEGYAPVPLVCWVVLDNGDVYGVGVGDDGKVDLGENIEDRQGFTTYRKGEK
jgi:hypothetical protein